MKINIQKLQQGGGFTTPTYIVNTAPVSAPSTAATSQKTAASQNILDDETYKELISKGGLVNDVNQFTEYLSKLQNSSSLPFLDSSNRGSAIRMIGKINELKQSKALWEDSVKRASDMGGLGEVAVGTSGELYTKDSEGNVRAMSLGEYSRKRDKVQALTVAELMRERQYNPKLTGVTQLFDVANNAIGVDKIKDEIKGMISALGTETTDITTSHTKDWAKAQYGALSESLVGKKPTREEWESLDSLKQMIDSPDTQINMTKITTSERNHIDKALDYIWSTLGSNKQQKLTAVAAINGRNPKQIILDMLEGQTNYSSTIKTSTETPKGVATKAAQERNISTFELLHTGKTGKENVAWNDPGSGKTYNLVATGSGILTNPDGTPIGWNTVGNILSGKTGVLFKTGEAYFGDQKVSPADLQKVIYDNGETVRVYMPTDEKGAPNFARLQEIQGYEKQVQDHPNWTPQEINNFFKQRNLGFIQVDGNKEYIETKNFKPFLMASGYTTDESGVTKNNTKIKALSSAEEDQVTPALEDVWTKNKVKGTTGWLSTTYYKGSIFIPYRETSSMYAAAIGHGLKTTPVSYEQARVNQEEYRSLQNKGRINADKSALGL